jgi:hypothetical protein
MSGRNTSQEFRRLLSVVRRMMTWRFRVLEVYRKERLGKGALPGVLTVGATLSGSRGWINCALSHPDPRMVRSFARLTAKLGYHRGERSFDSPARALEEEHARIVRACTSGRVSPEDRRPDHLLSLKAKDLVAPGKAKAMIEFLRKNERQGWLPRRAFFRRERRVRVGGYRWSVYYDGYWEPLDRDRDGLELNLLLLSNEIHGSGDWERLVAQGFVHRVDTELGRMGYDVPVRSEDWPRKRENAPYLIYDKGVREPQRFAAEVMAFLAWIPT